MPEFHKVCFDEDELEAIRQACDARSGDEERLLDEAAGGSLEGAVLQESRADDMLLIKSTVSIFKPGQTILITGEDLSLIKNCLEDQATDHAESAIKKIDASLSSREAGRR